MQETTYNHPMNMAHVNFLFIHGVFYSQGKKLIMR
jgi:hypothetical protein